MYRLPGPVRYSRSANVFRACQIIIWLGNRGLSWRKSSHRLRGLPKDRREYRSQSCLSLWSMRYRASPDTFGGGVLR